MSGSVEERLEALTRLAVETARALVRDQYERGLVSALVEDALDRVEQAARGPEVPPAMQRAYMAHPEAKACGEGSAVNEPGRSVEVTVAAPPSPAPSPEPLADVLARVEATGITAHFPDIARLVAVAKRIESAPWTLASPLAVREYLLRATIRGEAAHE